VADFAAGQLIFQCGHNGTLTYDVIKSLGAVLSIKGHIRHENLSRVCKIKLDILKAADTVGG
jgi:hypothetical protein